MSKKQIIFGFFLLYIFYDVGAISLGESYVYTEKWYQGKGIGGEIRIQLTILEICNTKIKISIEKDMTPFLQKLDFIAEARYEKDKYVFHCLDNWGNKVFGYFNIDTSDNEKIIIFFDVEEFSDFGKDVGRLYGETSVLLKGTLLF
jgi:hypothetical protein